MSIIRYYGGNISLNRLVELTNTDKEGTTFYDLKKAAEKIGFDVNGYKVTNTEKLNEIEKPFISQVVIDNYMHFVVIYKITNNKITIMDPAKGMVKKSYE